MFNSPPILALRQAIDLDGSLIPPPPGVESNFANPPNRNDLGKAVDLTSLVLATVFFILRVYTRFKLRSRINIVDVLSTLAFVRIMITLCLTYFARNNALY
ncbi:hypothetical protein ANO14919_091070 [Xylariales sp. No.14919]|nr:hypothetical protein ANO14919_091070 [Xylariales sp. No.14919]